MALHNNCVALFDPFIKSLDIMVEHATPEFTRVVMHENEQRMNVWGAAHGGVICTLIDAAFGIAANDGQQTAVVTLSTSIEFLRAGLKWPLAAEARLSRKGRRILNYDVKVLDAQENLVAHALISGYLTDLQLPEKYAQCLEEQAGKKI